MLGAATPLPVVCFTDRGPGYYKGANGSIVRKHQEALVAEGFRPFAGPEAAWQPADIPDVLVHETAAGWLKNWTRQHPTDLQWGTMAQKEGRIKTSHKEFVKYAHEEYNVEGLCGSYVDRLEKLKAAGGERLAT